MSAENTVTRGGRDLDPQADQGEQAGFQIPPELRGRYEVRLIGEDGAPDRRIGLFLAADRENPSIEISGNGERIVARKEDPETIDALVKIAKHNGWEGIDVDGSPEFRKAVWTAGTREGLVVRGYEPEFAELAQMDKLRREDAERREREAASKAPIADQVAGKSAGVEATVAGRTTDGERSNASQGERTIVDDLSSEDQRLLLTVSAYTRDRKALVEDFHEHLSPMEAQFMSERLEVNRDNLDGALDRALESETLAASFKKAGYEPDDLRSMAAKDLWDKDIADAIYLVRSSLNREDVARETLSAFVDADREAQAHYGDKDGAPDPRTNPETPLVREEREHAAADHRHESEALAELFLHGPADRIAAEPRLANALQAQATMERHLGEVFEGDVGQTSAATLESRQMISDVLRRGLDVSVREPTPVRQIEPPQPTPDLER